MLVLSLLRKLFVLSEPFHVWVSARMAITATEREADEHPKRLESHQNRAELRGFSMYQART